MAHEVGTVVYGDGWGLGQMFAGTDGDRDNLKTSCGDSK